MYDWDTISNLGEDIAKYLKKRYNDYCKDRNEKFGFLSDNLTVKKRHEAMRDWMVELGIKLSEKLSFFLDESRKELFEQIYERNESLDSFFKIRYDEICKELDETNKALPFHERRDSYTLHCEKSDKEKQLFNHKEIMKNDHFIENIDKRRAEYEKIKVEYEKKKVEDEKRRAKEKARKERIIKKKGHSNIKPIDFYERLYYRYGAPFGYKRFYFHGDEYELMQQEREWDVYFDEKGKPTEDDYKCPREKFLRYKPDSPEGNKTYLDRCKQLLEVFRPFCVDKDDYGYDYNNYQSQIVIYQEYLDKGYLITRQIANISSYLGDIFWDRIGYENQEQLSVFDKLKYKIDIFNDDSFDITAIKLKVNESIKNIDEEDEIEVGILTPIESLKEYLKEHNNRITAKEYSILKNISYKMALVILKRFVDNEKLKSKKEERGLNVFYV